MTEKLVSQFNHPDLTNATLASNEQKKSHWASFQSFQASKQNGAIDNAINGM